MRKPPFINSTEYTKWLYDIQPLDADGDIPSFKIMVSRNIVLNKNDINWSISVNRDGSTQLCAWVNNHGYSIDMDIVAQHIKSIFDELDKKN